MRLDVLWGGFVSCWKLGVYAFFGEDVKLILIGMVYYWTLSRFFRALPIADSTYVKVKAEYKIIISIATDKTKSSEQDDWGKPKKLNVSRGSAKRIKIWLR